MRRRVTAYNVLTLVPLGCVNLGLQRLSLDFTRFDTGDQ